MHWIIALGSLAFFLWDGNVRKGGDNFIPANSLWPTRMLPTKIAINPQCADSSKSGQGDIAPFDVNNLVKAEYA
jgi:hypothetical protein